MKKLSVCGNFKADFDVTFAVIQPSLPCFKTLVAQSVAMSLVGDKEI